MCEGDFAGAAHAPALIAELHGNDGLGVELVRERPCGMALPPGVVRIEMEWNEIYSNRLKADGKMTAVIHLSQIRESFGPSRIS